jgi:tetratricopeptide (TPR) repeat protein
VFPISYSAYQKFAFYSSWRHMIFIYPMFVVFSCNWVLSLIKLKKFNRPLLVIISCILSLIHPIIWAIKNHPFEYIYFNELSGGFNRNYQNYETDYWQVSIKKSLDWLYQNEGLKNKKNIVLGTNAVPFCRYMLKHYYNDTTTKVVQTGIKSIHYTNWDYLIINDLFFSKQDFIKYFPPQGTIHTDNIDGIPVCAVVKRKTKLDYLAMQAMYARDYPTSDSLATLYLKDIDPNNEKMIETVMYCKIAQNRIDECLKICESKIILFPDNTTLLYYAGVCKSIKGDYYAGIDYLELALNKKPINKKKIYKDLSNLYNLVGNRSQAEKYNRLFKEQK